MPSRLPLPGNAIQKLDTVTALKQMTPSSETVVVMTLGQNARWDGNGRYYRADPVSVLVPDDLEVVQSTVDPTGRWISFASFILDQPKLTASMVLCAGFIPLSTGADSAELVVPYDPADGTTVITWDVKRIDFRVSSAGGAPEFDLEKSSVAGIFAASTIDSVTMGSGDYEVSTNPAAQTVVSGDKLRFNATTLGTAVGWTIAVLLEEV